MCLTVRLRREPTGSQLSLGMSNSISTFNTKIECERYWCCVRFCVPGVLVSGDNKVGTIFTSGKNFLYRFDRYISSTFVTRRVLKKTTLSSYSETLSVSSVYGSWVLCGPFVGVNSPTGMVISHLPSAPDKSRGYPIPWKRFPNRV